ncbi:MAG: hypothetical protein K2M01_02180, partial [Paramuribaculum sp.]|nr:hypothetical protein [Paramuribaculum sp.]
GYTLFKKCMSTLKHNDYQIDTAKIAIKFLPDKFPIPFSQILMRGNPDIGVGRQNLIMNFGGKGAGYNFFC